MTLRELKFKLRQRAIDMIPDHLREYVVTGGSETTDFLHYKSAPNFSAFVKKELGKEHIYTNLSSNRKMQMHNLQSFYWDNGRLDEEINLIEGVEEQEFVNTEIKMLEENAQQAFDDPRSSVNQFVAAVETKIINKGNSNFGILASIGWNSNGWSQEPTEEDLRLANSYGYVAENGHMHEAINFGLDSYPQEPEGTYIAYTPNFNKVVKKANEVKVVFFTARDPDKKTYIVGLYAFPEIGKIFREANHEAFKTYDFGNVKSSVKDIVLFDKFLNSTEAGYLPDNKQLSKQGFNYLPKGNVKTILLDAIDANPESEKLKDIYSRVFDNKPQSEIEEGDLSEVNQVLPEVFRKGRNQILFGPPGTGKTYSLKNDYFQFFTEHTKRKTKEEFEKEIIEDLSWWEVVALILAIEGDMRVPEIREHKYLKIKLSLSNNNSVNQVIWGLLQAHTSPDFDNVKVATRSEPFIFQKKEKSVWNLIEEDCREKTPQVYEIKDKLEKYRDTSETKYNFSFTTFHQSFSYEDFIEGIKPVLNEQEDSAAEAGEVNYKLEKGVFYRAVDKACKLAGFIGLKDCLENYNQDERKEMFSNAAPYGLFIDEINRGNVSAVFGELITLIEDNKRLTNEDELVVDLPYSKNRFAVPPNLFIIGTMNTADRSVEALDTALRRRFSFIEMPPQPDLLNSELSEGEIFNNGIDLAQLLKTINIRIEKLIDKDHLIGHSYFMSVTSIDDLKQVFYNKIIPLLQEYFFGDYGKIGLVLGGGFVEVIDSSAEIFPDFNYDLQGLDEREVYKIVDYRQSDGFLLRSNGQDKLIDFVQALKLLMKQNID